MANEFNIPGIPTKVKQPSFVLPSNNLLRGVAANQIRNHIFTADDLETETSNQKSFLNTPVFSNLIFEPDPLTGATGTFTDIDGNDQTFNGLRIDLVLFQITMSKNIVKTAVQGFNGTIKEYTSDGDYQISVNGSLVSENPNVQPEQMIRDFIQLMEIPEALTITSEFLSYFGISSVVVESYSMQQVAGFRNVQPFTINMLSDKPIELR